jgi:phosphatidate cytidylyltransferase
MRQRKQTQPPVSPAKSEENYSQTEPMSEDTDEMVSGPEDVKQSRALTPIDESSDASAFERRTKFRTRTIWTLILISSFFAIIGAGHFYCSVLVLCLIGGMFYEITKLKRDREKEHKLPYFFAMRWYWFVSANFFFLRIFLAPQLERLAQIHPSVEFVLKYHQIISYGLFLAGFVLFVLTLRRFSLRYQFQQLSWALVTILICVIQGAAHIANIYNGLVWFLLPTLMVIVNDIFAYLFGITVGRTPLIKLSPKKTLEGFIGGSIATVVFAIVLCEIMERYSFFMCPMKDITLLPFQSTDCVEYPETRGFIGASPLKIHGLILASFASLVAPFGGFFASGFKRAFKIKDFSNVFESHGGFTDRFDCQIVMGMFTYIYVNTFVSSFSSSVSVESLVSLARYLSAADKARLVAALAKI